ncbi:O-Antigen ligase [Brevundimonas sp. SH203]|uniref:O-antigen ligase family protein n=1 Tax=Brevundimonas sp. SH203 TaxID=345167 RepID=UPI0009C564FA|nr:O-antigen ligase family protein [Brevundimonas sp. SH203]GAW40331.1 O-Antigen ligase [Brevundimonas sp. SH203]
MRGAVAAGRRRRLRWSQVTAAYGRTCLALLGMGATAPLFLTPGLLSGPRLGDLALLIALPMAGVEFGRMTPPLRAVGWVAGLFLTVTMLAQQSAVGASFDGGDAAFWFRWIAASLVAPPVAGLLVRDEACRRLFFAAVLIGAAVHVATSGLSLLIGREVLQAVGLASPRAMVTTAAAQVRITTLAEHPNAAMAMIGLAVPAGIALARGRWTRSVATWAGVALALAGFAGTLSRAGLAAAGVAWLARIAVGRRWRERFNVPGAVLALCVVAAGVLMLQGGADLDDVRFAERFDRAALADNLAGRVETWRRTLDQAADRPWGAGWTTAQEMGADRAASVSHNGYLFMARTVGAAAAVVLLVLHLASVARMDAFTPLSACLLVAMLAEDLTQGAGFVFLCCLVAALVWRRATPP